MSAAELRSRTRDIFSYILLSCPNFPECNKTSIDKEFGELTEGVIQIMESVRSEEAKQWLRLCLSEIRKAKEHYTSGDRSAGMGVLQLAEEHFDNAFSRKSTAPRFIVGESGPAQDSDSGFPE